MLLSEASGVQAVGRKGQEWSGSWGSKDAVTASCCYPHCWLLWKGTQALLVKKPSLAPSCLCLAWAVWSIPFCCLLCGGPPGPLVCLALFSLRDLMSSRRQLQPSLLVASWAPLAFLCLPVFGPLASRPAHWMRGLALSVRKLVSFPLPIWLP